MVMGGKDYRTYPFLFWSLASLPFVFSPSNHILKQKVSFTSQTKHNLRDSGLGVGEEGRGLEPQDAVNMVLSSFDVLWLCPNQSWEQAS